MRLYYDSGKAEEIRNKLIKKFMERQGHGNEVHLSDTCHCEMKAYNRLSGLVDPLYTAQIIGYMMIGLAGEEVLKMIFPPEQCEYESLDIVPSHVDVLEDFRWPLEIKWSVQKIFKAQDVPRGWLLQHMRYLAKHNANVGWLLIMNLFSRQLMAFKMVTDVDERMEQLQLIRDSKARILYAVSTGDTSNLIIIPKECSGCFYKPSKKRRELGMGTGCPRYVKGRGKKSSKAKKAN